jgi:enolase-phosphatase E1
MSQDLKIPYLKSLQGYLWLKGYKSGALRCPLFPDVEPKLQSWHRASIPIIIYSSGSVPAQKLLFQYTNSTPDADLQPLLSNYFDTVNAGPKTDKASYEKIAATRKEDTGKWLFLSDNVKEVDAAKEAGMQSWVVFREGNPQLSLKDREGQVVIESFDEIPSQSPKARGRGRPKKRKAGEVSGSSEKDVKTPPKRTRQGLRSSG